MSPWTMPVVFIQLSTAQLVELLLVGRNNWVISLNKKGGLLQLMFGVCEVGAVGGRFIRCYVVNFTYNMQNKF